ncbi:hypothetical protein Y032_0050g2060 [Ancylostoma ceylanicum]|uniref:Uncharacterized protein n=1 Tax=Ancylostoma ceylanicum TaxID=53326 RepID=A0A016UAT5_9BILA|nr:hypothetical protein Y032_0050g2060 [Ancylostoma ceylanicum]
MPQYNNRYASFPPVMNYPLYLLKYLPETQCNSPSKTLAPILFKHAELLRQHEVAICRKNPTMIDQVVETLVVIAKCVVMTLVASVKALLPMGVLPRKSVKGETVLITGSGSGLGRGMAIEFAKLGSKIVLWDINEKGNMETKKMLDDLKAVVLKLE